VSICLNNTWNPRLAPRAGEHQFSGGIYRNDWLVATAPLHVTWFGTFARTPHVTASEGSLSHSLLRPSNFS
jgi:beta-galactosidase